LRPRFEQLSTTYLRLALSYVFVGRSFASTLCSLRSQNHAERLGPSKELCESQGVLSIAYGFLGFNESARRLSQEAHEISKSLDSTWLRGRALNHKGMTDLYAGHWREAHQAFAEAIEIFSGCGDLYELGIAYGHIFLPLFYRGDFRRAYDLVSEGAPVLERKGADAMGRFVSAQVGWASAMLGEWDGALERIERAIRIANDTGEGFLESQCNMMMGEGLLAADEPERAVRYLERSTAVISEQNLIHEYVFRAFPLLAKVRVEILRGHRGRSDKAKRRLRRLAARSVRQALRVTRKRVSFRATALLAKAMLERERGNHARAEMALSESLSVAQGLGSWFQTADALIERGRQLASLPKPDERGARENLERALDLFQRCGSKPYVERTEALMAELDRQ
jgi:tetratricopeptide (TPR) repeat protein